MSNLDALVAELETLAKANPGDGDEKIVAAAGDDDDSEEGKKMGADGDGDADDMPMMKKSFTVKLADGTEVEAEDGTEMVKALELKVGALTEKLDASQSDLVKALGTAVTLIKSQGAAIKQLGDKVQALSGEGRGRKSTLAVMEKPAAGETMAKSNDAGLTAETFMAKAMAAFDANKISGKDLTVIDVCLRQGQAPDAALVNKVLSA